LHIVHTQILDTMQSIYEYQTCQQRNLNYVPRPNPRAGNIDSMDEIKKEA